jgi:hypothetical protein
MIVGKVSIKWLRLSMGIINIMGQGKIKYIDLDKSLMVLETINITIIIH